MVDEPKSVVNQSPNNQFVKILAIMVAIVVGYHYLKDFDFQKIFHPNVVVDVDTKDVTKGLKELLIRHSALSNKVEAIEKELTKLEGRVKTLERRRIREDEPTEKPTISEEKKAVLQQRLREELSRKDGLFGDIVTQYQEK